jgi:hypothetical protein
VAIPVYEGGALRHGRPRGISRGREQPCKRAVVDAATAAGAEVTR